MRAPCEAYPGGRNCPSMPVVESHGVYDVQDARGDVHDGLQDWFQEQSGCGLRNSAVEDAPGRLMENMGGCMPDHDSD